jgi:hypothetical protein
LNWIIFDRDYNFIDGGYKRMTDAAKEYGQDVAHEKLSQDLTITQRGYVYTKSPVIQMEDYYPFGLTFNSYQRESSVKNKYKFQGQEHIDDLNLGWDSFKEDSFATGNNT